MMRIIGWIMENPGKTALFWGCVVLSIWVTIGYVIVHFVTKYW